MKYLGSKVGGANIATNNTVLKSILLSLYGSNTYQTLRKPSSVAYSKGDYFVAFSEEYQNSDQGVYMCEALYNIEQGEVISEASLGRYNMGTHSQEYFSKNVRIINFKDIVKNGQIIAGLAEAGIPSEEGHYRLTCDVTPKDVITSDESPFNITYGWEKVED